jgi:FkbM family methyltransferase
MTLQLNTRTKIALARVAHMIVMTWRRAVGVGNVVETVRGDARWRLDLNEGIDFAIYLLGRFEAETVRAYRRIVKPGDTVLDIGANIGAHTLFLAQAVGNGGNVIAFEPTTYAYHKLLANIGLNVELARRIRAEQMMLIGDGAKPPAEIYSSWPLLARTENQHAKHLGVPMGTQGARHMALDDYLDEAGVAGVRFIKMDVDGHECAVLRGARRLLHRDKPVLLAEIMPYGLAEAGSSLEEMLGLLTAANYRLYRLNGSPLPSDSTLTRYIPAAGSINVICQPS